MEIELFIPNSACMPYDCRGGTLRYVKSVLSYVITMNNYLYMLLNICFVISLIYIHWVLNNTIID